MRPLLDSVIILFLATGCTVSRPSLGKGAADSATVRSGNVFLVRGLLGTFSTGMDDLRDSLRENGVPAVALQHTAEKSAARLIAEHPEMRQGPLIIIGHSLGAGAAVEICELLAAENIPVDLLVTLDPVMGQRVPPNIKVAVNYYRSNGLTDLIPLFRGVALQRPKSGGGQLHNIDLNRKTAFLEPGTNHFTIDTNGKLQHAIVAEILSMCPPVIDMIGPQSAAGELRPAGISNPESKGTHQTQ